MNKDSIQALPSAEHPIASQNQPFAAVPKGHVARPQKRAEDELAVQTSSDAAQAADSAPAESTDQQVLLAQAEPAAAAGSSASAGAAVAPAAAEGSASAGAGAPVAAAAAAGSSGLSVGALAAGAGGVGLAAAAAGGGGGGGSAAAPTPTPTPAPAPTQTTTPPPAPTPTPTTTTSIHNFAEYTASINAGGTTPPANASVVAGPGPTSTVDISGGFSRSVLPQTLSSLRPSMTSNVTGASAATINDGGIVVDLQGNPDSLVVAHSNAASGASNVMWMQNMAVKDLTGQGTTVAVASAAAGGAGSDAEIGIQHLSMQLAGSGALNGRTDLSATATGGGSAYVLVSDVTLNMDSSGAGASGASIFSHLHMGVGEGSTPGILASASDAGSSANVAVTGDVSLRGHGDDVYVYNSGIFSQGTNGGAAHTDIGGNLNFASDGREAHSYVLVSASTDAVAGSVADVHIHGNVDLQSTGSDLALTRAAVRAAGEGTVEVDGHLNLNSIGPVATSSAQVIAQGDGHVSIHSIGMTIEGGNHQGWMDLFTDHSGGLDIGAVNLTASAASEMSLYVQHGNDALTGVVDDTFLAHAASTVGVSVATANVGGAGDVHMYLNSQTFGTINQAGSLNGLDVHYQLGEQNFAGIGTAPMTTINGFSAAHDQVAYNGVAADATNFTDAGSFTTLAAMNAAVDTALDGTHKYVFAVYNGTEDINHNGLADDHGSGVLAWDNDGSGVTSVLMLPGVTTLTPTDIA